MWQNLVINVHELKENNDFSSLYGKIESLTDEDKKVNLTVVLHNREDLKNLKLLFSNIRHRWQLLRKLRKCAVITDSDWIENLSETIGFLTPWLRVKAFEPDERDEAEAWLNSLKKDERHGLAIWPKEDYLHLIVYEKLTLLDFKALNNLMRSYEDDVSLLIEFSDYEGMTLRAFLEDLKLGFSHFRKFRKIAIIIDKNVKSISHLSNVITPGISCKAFPDKKINEAVDWIKQ